MKAKSQYFFLENSLCWFCYVAVIQNYFDSMGSILELFMEQWWIAEVTCWVRKKCWDTITECYWSYNTRMHFFPQGNSLSYSLLRWAELARGFQCENKLLWFKHKYIAIILLVLHLTLRICQRTLFINDYLQLINNDLFGSNLISHRSSEVCVQIDRGFVALWRAARGTC